MIDEATLAAIRARHEHDERWLNSPSMICPQSHADRATLLAALDETRAENERLRSKLEVDESGYDGIDCRNETIKQQDRINDGLRERERALREALGAAASDLDAAAEDAGRSYYADRAQAAREAALAATGKEAG